MIFSHLASKNERSKVIKQILEEARKKTQIILPENLKKENEKDDKKKKRSVPKKASFQAVEISLE